MADVPPPPPLPPPGNSISILGDSISSAPSSNNLSSTQSQSASSLQSTNGSESTAASSTQSKPGKRPATMDELRQSSRSWSLAGDAGVLLYFRQFSQNMLRKTHELETAVDKLAYETKGLDSKVHNTFNDFLMLSNKQFIENRVYDEEVAQEEAGEKENSQPQNKTREQLESEILPRFSEAVNLGLQVLEDAFITVELKPSEESDDEDEESLPAGYVPDPIIEPKDTYASRPLPYLIGTAEFFHDETLGLIEVDDDEEETKKQAKGDDDDDDDDESETESEESEESETETETESSESSDEEIKKPKKKQISDGSGSEETDSDGDLFGETKKKVEYIDEESDSEEVKQPKPKMDIQAELVAKLGIPGQMPAAKISEDKDDKSDTQSVTSRKSGGDTQSIVSAAETASITSASKGKKEKKHTSRTKSIESHKKHRSSTHEHKHHKPPHQQQQEQEEESDEDLFGESKPKSKFEDDSPFGKKGGMFSGGGSLFDDDGEGDLFGDSDVAKEPVDAIEKPAEPETPTEIKPRTRTTSTGKKIPAGAVSLFGDTNLFGPSPTKENSIKEEAPKEKETTQEGAKKPPPIVKGLFSDEEEDELFAAAKPKQDTLKEPPKQKRKKTLELFDDNEDSLFGAKETSPVTAKPTPTANKSAAGQAETANETAKATDGLFSGDDSKLNPAKAKPAAKKADSKPKVLSLFDDDDAEEQDWFDNVNPIKNKTPGSKAKETSKPQTPKEDTSLFAEPSQVEAKPAAKKEEAKKPSKAKKAVSLFDEDDDEDLFGSITPVSTPSKPAQAEKQKKIEGSKQETKTEKKSDNLDIKPKATKKQKAKSFIDDDDSGLFGDDQDDLFTASSKPQAKKESTASKPKQKSAPSLFLDDENDLFSTSTKPAKKEEKTAKPEKSRSKSKQSVDSIENTEVKQEKKPEVKQDVKSEDSKKPREAAKGTPGDEEDGDLFSEKKASREIKTQEVTKNETQDTEEETSATPKPKKFAGSVSLFGGIDPFAEKKNLRSPSKEKAKSSSFDKETNDDLFAKKPASDDTVPVAIENKTPGDQPVSVQPTKPKIAFNPATMLPGASPPKRIIEAAPTSLDDPPAVQTLANPNKDRARIQKKRRPPSRQLRQSTIDILDQLTTDAIPESSIETLNPDSFTSIQKTVETKPKEKPNLDFNDLDQTRNEPAKAMKESKKTITATDIFSDEDDLFSSKPVLARGTPNKSSEKAKDVQKTAVDNVGETRRTISEKTTISKTDNESTEVSAKIKTKNDDLFDDKLDADNVAKSTEAEKPKKARDIDLFFGDKEPSDEIFNNESDSSGTVDKLEKRSSSKNESTKNKENENFISSDKITKQNRKDSEDEDLFGPSTPAKVEVQKERVEDKMGKSGVSVSGENLLVKKEKESGKTKKKKETSSIFDTEVDNDLFGGEIKKKGDKKETTKKTKKSTKPVTDDDLFGDSGSIFDDIPSKSKDKKKKKPDSGIDIFAKNDSDIFATGGEKKTKAKKKTEKATRPKAAKSQVKDENTPNIFDDPLNALGGD